MRELPAALDHHVEVHGSPIEVLHHVVVAAVLEGCPNEKMSMMWRCRIWLTARASAIEQATTISGSTENLRARTLIATPCGRSAGRRPRPRCRTAPWPSLPSTLGPTCPRAAPESDRIGGDLGDPRSHRWRTRSSRPARHEKHGRRSGCGSRRRVWSNATLGRPGEVSVNRCHAALRPPGGWRPRFLRPRRGRLPPQVRVSWAGHCRRSWTPTASMRRTPTARSGTPSPSKSPAAAEPGGALDLSDLRRAHELGRRRSARSAPRGPRGRVGRRQSATSRPPALARSMQFPSWSASTRSSAQVGPPVTRNTCTRRPPGRTGQPPRRRRRCRCRPGASRRPRPRWRSGRADRHAARRDHDELVRRRLFGPCIAPRTPPAPSRSAATGGPSPAGIGRSPIHRAAFTS